MPFWGETDQHKGTILISRREQRFRGNSRIIISYMESYNVDLIFKIVWSYIHLYIEMDVCNGYAGQ